MTVSVTLDNYQTRHCLEDITEHFFDEGEKGKVYLTTAEHVSLLTWFKVNYDAWREGDPIYPLLIEREVWDGLEYLEVHVKNPNDFERLKVQVSGYEVGLINGLAEDEDDVFLLFHSASKEPLRYHGLTHCITYCLNGTEVYYRAKRPRALRPSDFSGLSPLENK